MKNSTNVKTEDYHVLHSMLQNTDMAMETLKAVCDEEFKSTKNTYGFRPHPNKDMEKSIDDELERKRLAFIEKLKKRHQETNGVCEVSKETHQSSNFVKDKSAKESNWHLKNPDVHALTHTNNQPCTKDINTLRHRLWYTEHLCGTLQMEVNRLNNEVREWKIKFRDEATNRAQNKSLQDALLQKKQENEKLLKRCAYRNDQLLTVKERNMELREDLKSVNATLFQCDKRNKVLQEQLHRETENFSNELENLKKQNDSLRENNNSLLQKYQNALAKCARLTSENKAMKMELEDYYAKDPKKRKAAN